ncbi:hypothetical protein U7230_02790 [Carboxydochorda subterranea]|uniref:Outer membrane protein beta-barrel domain-containing protein n=1 Tax=Carboxydichorda subterranea TaxID=3109565 RepID=A0ABZ1BYW0_9FIRM|nr:hypothetical protein [Limnochorda sp. L945t]WRP17957.1 hypothetical protein U7230_02790 [Limnochorda sp. L945t]
MADKRIGFVVGTVLALALAGGVASARELSVTLNLWPSLYSVEVTTPVSPNVELGGGAYFRRLGDRTEEPGYLPSKFTYLDARLGAVLGYRLAPRPEIRPFLVAGLAYVQQYDERGVGYQVGLGADFPIKGRLSLTGGVGFTGYRVWSRTLTRDRHDLYTVVGLRYAFSL